MERQKWAIIEINSAMIGGRASGVVNTNYCFSGGWTMLPFMAPMCSQNLQNLLLTAGSDLICISVVVDADEAFVTACYNLKDYLYIYIYIYFFFFQ